MEPSTAGKRAVCVAPSSVTALRKAGSGAIALLDASP